MSVRVAVAPLLALSLAGLGALEFVAMARIDTSNAASLMASQSDEGTQDIQRRFQ